MVILHIGIDSPFIDIAYHIFEEVNPSNNEFIFIGEKRNFVYIKETPVKLISKKLYLSKNFAESLGKYDMIIFHYLDDLKLQIIPNIPFNVKIVWIGWGADYYDLITNHNKKKLFLPLTKSLYEKNSKKFNNIIKIIKINHFFNKTNKNEIVNQIDYFSPVLFEDYELIKKVLPHFKPKYIPWNYGSLEDDLIKGFENYSISGNNILVGNNATYENNHLDAFEFLSRINTDKRMIISPLSYGNPIYRDDIIKYGKIYWGDRFIPLVDFLPIEDYNKIIGSCSVVIMDHIRQQALGNIISMMYFGAKIFLNENSPVFHFFKKEGALIFSIEELESEMEKRLNDSQIEHNRCVLLKYWGRKKILANTRSLIDTVI